MTEGVLPKWRADGRELCWWTSGDRTLMAATVELQAAAVRIGLAEPLFHLSRPFFQFASDGKRFLTLELEGGQHQELPMTVVLNWAAAPR